MGNILLIGSSKVFLVKILLTGATGFVGNSLTKELLKRGFQVSAALRKKVNTLPELVRQYPVGNFDKDIDFSKIFSGIDCVIHLAGKAHVVDKNKALVLNEFRQVNTIATLNLATQAAKIGVKRFIFISSIRVNGNKNNKPFTEKTTQIRKSLMQFLNMRRSRGC